MNRREMLIGAGALALAAAGRAEAQKKPAASPAGHMHEPSPYLALVDAATDCVRRGNLCMDHCLKMSAMNDNSMADCGATVHVMVATCNALLTVAATNSKHTKALAKLCADVCKDCEAACRKHADKSSVCKDCADSCAKMIAEAGKLA